jgi:hypothetical protein
MKHLEATFKINVKEIWSGKLLRKRDDGDGDNDDDDDDDDDDSSQLAIWNSQWILARLLYDIMQRSRQLGLLHCTGTEIYEL